LASSGYKGPFKVVDVQAQATDYAPAVAQATSGTDCIIAGFGQQQAQAFFPAFKQAGGKQKIIGYGGNSLAKTVIAKNPQATHDGTVVDYYPPIDDPRWKAFRDAYAKYATADAQ
jgi:ABC-type branched-subunit amino acid transport system substrate-binding protein